MVRDSRRGIRLSLDLLETREVPALVDFSQLAVDATTYDPTHILVKWRDGELHSPRFARGAEALGNGLYRLSLKPSVSVDQAISALERKSSVALVQPDYRVQISALPNDSSLGSLWGLHNTGQNGGVADADIDAPEAWNTNTGTRRTVVAVIDTGVDYRHPDLAANMWRNSDEIPGNGKDDDRNGYKDDVYGYDFANGDSNPMDDNGHGTHVAGTIGAVGNNGIGVAGVNWNTRIMALKFLDSSGSGYLSNAVKAINFAVANGANVINASFGGGGYNSAMATAISNARSRGVIVVAAAGNDGTNNDTNAVYPANYSGDNLIAVAATDRSDRLASFSNYGRTTVDIAAPGVGIYSTLPNGRYGTYSGTSMATPHVAGAIALVWDAHPTWTYRQVIDAVLGSTDSLSSLTNRVAHGRLNVARAIADGQSPPTDPTPEPDSTPTNPAPVTTTQTFTSTNVGQSIRDFGRVVSTITIAKDMTIQDLNVKVNASHTYAGDVRMTLVGPDGTRVVLFNRRGGSGDNLTNTVFDDEGSESIYEGTAPFAGSFKPEYVLSTFDGKNAKGTWQLIVEDVALFDSGRLNSWSLTIKGATSASTRSATSQAASSANLPSAPPVSRNGQFLCLGLASYFVRL
jgi:subtilisin family serine protease